jgi:hypothetical protein
MSSLRLTLVTLRNEISQCKTVIIYPTPLCGLHSLLLRSCVLQGLTTYGGQRFPAAFFQCRLFHHGVVGLHSHTVREFSYQ